MNIDETAMAVLRTLIRHHPAYESQHLTRALFEQLAGQALAAIPEPLTDDERAHQVRRLANMAETEFAIRQDEALTFDAIDADHEPWLPGRQAELFREGGCWRNFLELLDGSIPDAALARLGTDTDLILERLEDPHREGTWKRRGLVVGQVQSGKTNNYLGLVTKAIDAGYKLIVVLAGTHDNLRVQTQKRFDQALIGSDRSYPDGRARPVGVGLRTNRRQTVISMTKATNTGDFQKTVAEQIGSPFQDTDVPTVFVIKKHWKILENLHEWLRENANLGPGQTQVSGFPLLLIDDEADNASVDTSNHADDEANPTKTNAGIRTILNLFRQSAYVGYTATPFANIFIDPEVDDDMLGADLFPKDFIITLKAPDNYVGPGTMFDLEATTGRNPLVRDVGDLHMWLPPGHDSTFEPRPGRIPPSLRRAVDSFILTCAARRMRGFGHRPNSMLVHVTRFKITQKAVADEIESLVSARKNELLYGPLDGPAWTMLRDLWNEDFQPTSVAVSRLRNDAPTHSFDEMVDHIRAAVPLLLTKTINGDSEDVLQEDVPIAQIAIGGMKLSRGLTLPDLSVSYYDRTTHMYDTLLQMGRWFGYRDNYLDLCRVFTSPTIVMYFRNINRAVVELDEELTQLRRTRTLTPLEFGLKVRHSPGMLVTSRVKMRAAERRRIGFGNTRPETTSLDIDPHRRMLTVRHFESLLGSIHRVAEFDDNARGGNLRWTGVPASDVIGYFRRLEADSLYSHSTRSRPKGLADYIETRNRNGCLSEWTVMVNSNQAASARMHSVDGLPNEIGMATRGDTGVPGRYSIGSLIDPKDELADRHVVAPDHSGPDPTGSEMRRMRPETHGLLILYVLDPVKSNDNDGDERTPYVGYCVSFPVAENDNLVDYIVNPVGLGEDS